MVPWQNTRFRKGRGCACPGRAGRTERHRFEGEAAGRRPSSRAPGQSTIDSVGIARVVGVARSTVSKVLNGYPYVAAETRERILQAIRAYEYYPNHSAQVLAGKQTNTLGLFFFNPGHFSEDVLADFMISSVIENASAMGYRTLAYVIRDPQDGATRGALKEAFYQRRIAAGIFIGARTGSRSSSSS